MFDRQTSDRFSSKVDRELGTNGCWNWTGAKFRSGYGAFRLQGSTWRANRLAWILNFGPISGDIHVLHHCDNRACVRPDHLFIGDNTVNAADRNGKGRQVWGEEHGMSKLSEWAVREIKRLYSDGLIQRDIADMFGITQSAVSLIVNQKRWQK